MPTGHHVSRNNCQSFCVKLFSRIRVPTVKEEVLIGCNKIRRRYDKDTIKNRWAHFIRFKILEAVAQTSRNLPPFLKIPLDLESAIDAACYPFMHHYFHGMETTQNTIIRPFTPRAVPGIPPREPWNPSPVDAGACIGRVRGKGTRQGHGGNNQRAVSTERRVDRKHHGNI